MPGAPGQVNGRFIAPILHNGHSVLPVTRELVQCRTENARLLPTDCEPTVEFVIGLNRAAWGSVKLISGPPTEQRGLGEPAGHRGRAGWAGELHERRFGV